METRLGGNSYQMRTFFRDILGTIILAIVIFFLLQNTVQSFVVQGPSMKDSFHNGDRLLVLKAKVTNVFHELERGDVAIFHPPLNQREDYIKRIVGLPGDTVEIKKEAVYINGVKLDEPYVKEPPHYTLDPVKVPENHYFVLGDNRNNSSDSHNGWTVPSENIIGKAWLLIWPPGLVPNYSLKEQLVGS